MSRAAYYNENDPKAAAWLRELILRGHLPEGDVDDRSIADVAVSDLRGYGQCHFFAGIGGWPHALRLAGWPDEKPVWTGSAPCQPFSQAGQRKGYDDERHLAPVWLGLIEQCRPATIFGEQVASAAGRNWLSDLRLEMERLGYAVGAADLCAAGAGAPHIRQRLFFGAVLGAGACVASPAGGAVERLADGAHVSFDRGRDAGPSGRSEHSDGCGNGRLADGDDAGPQGRGVGGHGTDQRTAGANGVAGGLADGQCGATERHGHEMAGTPGRVQEKAREQRIWPDAWDGGAGSRPHAPDEFWRDADWLFCRDAKWRPVEPGTFPLDHGIPARVGRLRGYGNAIVPQIAQVFIEEFSGAVIEAAA
ncbi:DNA cytosine methyltransferase [Roseovarius confluentis]|uniref:DNA cytosine methyltransferase n=1 Tax=Roseovarius TaxID=74030 RepID=UPI003C7A08CA